MDDFDITKEFLHQYGIKFRIATGSEMIHYISGKINPSCNGVFVLVDNENLHKIVANIFDAVDYVRENGLVKLA